MRGVQPCQQGNDDQTQSQQRPEEAFSSVRFPPGQLPVELLQLFRNNPYFVRLFRGDGLAQQRADGRFQRLRQGNEQIGVRNRQPRFP